MAGGAVSLTTTLGDVVSVAVGCLWRPGRRSPLNVLTSSGPWGVGGGGGAMADLRMESYVDGNVYLSFRSDRRLREGLSARMYALSRIPLLLQFASLSRILRSLSRKL